MRTLVVLLLYLYLTLGQGQNLGLTESDYEEDKTTSELSDGPPLNSNQWIHSVIFEPLPKIKLTRSSYQVTTTLDFLPFLEDFCKVNDYIKQFKKDLDNPDYTNWIPNRVENTKIALQNDTEMSCLLNSSGCHARPHQCLASIKIFKFKEEVNYVRDIFKNINWWFLAAIDHLEYHSSKSNNGTQYKHDISMNYSQYKHENYNTLTKEQTKLVLDVLWELKKITQKLFSQSFWRHQPPAVSMPNVSPLAPKISSWLIASMERDLKVILCHTKLSPSRTTTSSQSEIYYWKALKFFNLIEMPQIAANILNTMKSGLTRCQNLF